MDARREARFLGALFAGLAVAAGVACSDDAEPGATTTSSSGSAPISATDCKSRCAARATSCQGPASVCDSLCAGSVTEAQAQCLERKGCSELATAETLEEVCPVGSSSSSSGSSTSSSSGTTALTFPEAITIRATIPDGYTPVHTTQGGKVGSLFTVAPKPTFTPEPPGGQFPQVSKPGAVTLDAPARSGCEATFSFVINAEQIGVQSSAEDVLPSRACANLYDAMAKDGAKFTLTGVPWANSTTLSTVTIELE